MSLFLGPASPRPGPGELSAESWPPGPPPSLPPCWPGRGRRPASCPGHGGGGAASGAPARPPAAAAPSAVGCSVAAGVNGRACPQRGQTPPPAESLCPDPPPRPPSPPPTLAQVSSAPGAPSAGDGLVSGGGVWGEGEEKSSGAGDTQLVASLRGLPSSPPAPPRPAGRFLSGVSTPSSRAWARPALALAREAPGCGLGSEAAAHCDLPRRWLLPRAEAASRSQCVSSTQGQGPGRPGRPGPRPRPRGPGEGAGSAAAQPCRLWCWLRPCPPALPPAAPPWERAWV